MNKQTSLTESAVHHLLAHDSERADHETHYAIHGMRRHDEHAYVHEPCRKGYEECAHERHAEYENRKQRKVQIAEERRVHAPLFLKHADKYLKHPYLPNLVSIFRIFRIFLIFRISRQARLTSSRKRSSSFLPCSLSSATSPVYKRTPL